MNKTSVILLLLVCSSCRFGDVSPVFIEGHNLDDGHKICVIGDSGTGSDKQVAVAKALETENCNQIYLLGDAVYNDGIESANDQQLNEKFLKPYNGLLKTIPFYMAMGNHDYKSNPRAWLEVAKVHKNIIFPEMVYGHKFGDVCILSLDTNAYFFQQINWIKEISPKLKECKFTLSIGHHPYLSVGSHGDANFVMKLFLEKTALKVSDVYIAGHDHNLSDEGHFNKTHLFVSGAAAKLRDLKSKPRVWAESKLGYMTLIINRSSNLTIGYEFITVDPKTGKRSVAHFGSL